MRDKNGTLIKDKDIVLYKGKPQLLIYIDEAEFMSEEEYKSKTLLIVANGDDTPSLLR